MPPDPATRSGSLIGLESLAISSFSGPLPPGSGPAVTSLAATGRYTRLPPLLIDTAAATPATRADAANHFAVLTQDYRSLLLLRLRDALLAGQGAVITASGTLIAETVLEYTAQNALPDGLTALENGRFTMPSRIDRIVAEPCILAERPWFFNYGHWLIEGAAMLALAAATIRRENLTVIIGKTTGKMREITAASIAAILPGARILEHPTAEIWSVANLALPSPTHVPPLFKSPEALQRLRQAVLPANPLPPRRLFVSRSGAAFRRLVNEAEIFALCAAYGFEMIAPETLSFADQIAAFAAAEFVIGAKGAGLANCLFCQPRTRIAVLSPADFPDPFYWDLAAQLGCFYSEIFGRITTATHQGANDFLIDPQQLRPLLEIL